MGHYWQLFFFTMVRTILLKKPPIDKEQLAKAIEAVKTGQSVNIAAKNFEFNRGTKQKSKPELK